jgi:hypothetical protein
VLVGTEGQARDFTVVKDTATIRLAEALENGEEISSIWLEWAYISETHVVGNALYAIS